MKRYTNSEANIFHWPALMNRFTTTILLSIALLLIFTTVFGNYGLIQLLQVEQKLDTLRNKNQELASEIVRLENKIHAIEISRFELEKNSREQLGLSKPGEIVYIFPPETDQQKRNPSSDAKKESDPIQ